MINCTRKGKIIQTLTTFLVCCLMLSDGMHCAWPSVIAPILQSSESPVEDVTNSDVTLLETIYLIGGLLALAFVMYLPDKIGRKYTVLGAVLVSLISWLLIASFSNIVVFMVSRFLAGMAADIGYVILPMYIAEIADKDIRGGLCGLIYIMLTGGMVIMFGIGPLILVTNSAMIGASISAFTLISVAFLPDSPYYFLKINNVDKAKKSLIFLRGGADVKEELEDIKAAVERQEQEQGTFSDLIRSRVNRKALMLMSTIYVLQSVSGMQVLFMNVNTILDETTEYIPSSYGAFLYSIVLLLTGCFSMMSVDKFGRKRLLVVSGILIGISLTILATFVLLQIHHPSIAERSDWLPLFSVLFYAVALRIGIGFLPFLLNGELFATSVKSKGMTIADGCYLISGIVCLYLYRVLSEVVGMYLPLYILACGTVVISLLVFIYLPETKGKTLEEIQLMLSK